MQGVGAPTWHHGDGALASPDLPACAHARDVFVEMPRQRFPLFPAFAISTVCMVRADERLVRFEN
jgi:hypothetical protein